MTHVNSPCRMALRLSGLRHCFARPEPASLRVPPALRKHVGNFQPDQSTPYHLRSLLFYSEMTLPERQRIEAMPLVRRENR
ncbi:hypothetical protein CI104_05970 [Citrobacter farmeri]|uniref:Uncharacterized protein n=1 Tax=Citrobacter farmeri TaxID=67824 RepID=A0ACA8D398_9ENTR|nr:hypothetical protein CI104_05970 [Citrobacter farmeri]